jgi:ferredoxin
MALRVVIDYDRCRSNGQCAAVAPEVFAIDADGYVQHDEEQEESRRGLALHAARVCPTQAISVQSDG